MSGRFMDVVDRSFFNDPHVVRLRVLLPEAKQICLRQHRNEVWEALLAAEELLGWLDKKRAECEARLSGLERLLSSVRPGEPEPPEEAGP